MKSILLVDDETEISTELARMLRRFRFRVETAGTLEKALRVLKSSRFEAILLEFNLRSKRKGHPRTGAGLEVVRRLRALGMMTPVLIFTAMEGEFYVEASLEAGANEFILKTGGIVPVLSRLCTNIHSREVAACRSDNVTVISH
jgi:two-component system, OmpR family, response regulator